MPQQQRAGRTRRSEHGTRDDTVSHGCTRASKLLRPDPELATVLGPRHARWLPPGGHPRLCSPKITTLRKTVTELPGNHLPHRAAMRGGRPDRLNGTTARFSGRHDLRFALGSQQAELPVPGRHRGRQTPASIANAAPDSGCCAARQIRSSAALPASNMSGAVVTYRTRDATPRRVAGGRYATARGGVAGVNCGTITLGHSYLPTLNFTVTRPRPTLAGISRGHNNRPGQHAGALSPAAWPIAQVTAATYAGGAAGINYGRYQQCQQPGPRCVPTDTAGGRHCGPERGGPASLTAAGDTNREVYATKRRGGRHRRAPTLAGAAIRNAGKLRRGPPSTAATQRRGGRLCVGEQRP